MNKRHTAVLVIIVIAILLLAWSVMANPYSSITVVKNKVKTQENQCSIKDSLRNYYINQAIQQSNDMERLGCDDVGYKILSITKSPVLKQKIIDSTLNKSSNLIEYIPEKAPVKERGLPLSLGAISIAIVGVAWLLQPRERTEEVSSWNT